MELVFPFKNFTFHSLIELFSKDNFSDFVDHNLDRDEYEIWLFSDLFEANAQNYMNLLPDFENEILQITNTTSQNTIDSYFKELNDNLKHLAALFSKESITNKIVEWNQEEEIEATKKGKKPHISDETINENFYKSLIDLSSNFLEIANKYLTLYSEGKIKSKVEKLVFNKPAVFVEGEHDITFLNKAAELLGHLDIIAKIEIRQRGGYSNLDKLWDLYKDNNWETVPQRKLLLYDCDTNKIDEDLGFIFKRIIPTQKDGYVSKGIENLFPKEVFEKAISHKNAFVDEKHTTGIKRGVKFSETVIEINKDEKKNFCNWVCENGNKKDFENFSQIFKLIESTILIDDL